MVLDTKLDLFKKESQTMKINHLNPAFHCGEELHWQFNSQVLFNCIYLEQNNANYILKR